MQDLFFRPLKVFYGFKTDGLRSNGFKPKV